MYGDNVGPCRTPATMSKKSVSPSEEGHFYFSGFTKTYIHTHTYIYRHIHIDKYMYMFTYIYIYIYMYMYIHKHIVIYTNIYV